MSEPAFQSVFARLVTDPDFRDRIRNRGSAALVSADFQLSRKEMSDLVAVARSPGIDVMRTLHKGFRLNKLFSMLPLTCRLLGLTRLAREAGAFWAGRPASSFYYLEEAEAFASFLERRRREGLRVPYLVEVLAYERARRRPGPRRAAPATSGPIPPGVGRVPPQPGALAAGRVAWRAAMPDSTAPCIPDR